MFRAGHIQLYMADGQLSELNDELARSFLTDKLNVPRERITDLLELVEATVERVDPLDSLPIPVRDPKDEVILGAAITSNADFVVSDDNDLVDLAGDPRLGQLQIVNPRQFLSSIEQP